MSSLGFNSPPFLHGFSVDGNAPSLYDSSCLNVSPPAERAVPTTRTIAQQTETVIVPAKVVPTVLPSHEFVRRVSKEEKPAAMPKPWAGISATLDVMDNVSVSAPASAPPPTEPVTPRMPEVLPSHNIVSEARARAASEDQIRSNFSPLQWNGISSTLAMWNEEPAVFEQRPPPPPPVAKTAVTVSVATAQKEMSTPAPARKSVPTAGLEVQAWPGLFAQVADENLSLNCTPSPSPPARRRSSRALSNDESSLPATAVEATKMSEKAPPPRELGLCDMSPLSQLF